MEASTASKKEQLAAAETEETERAEAFKVAGKAHAKLEKQCDEWREKYAAFERRMKCEDLKHNKGEKEAFKTRQKACGG